MREEFLFDPLIGWLTAQGYTILEQHRGHGRGVDVVAVKDGRRLLVQLKGDSAALDVDFGTNLYQVMKLMREGSDEYAIGVSEAYIPHAKRCEHALKKLGIRLLVISGSGIQSLY